MENEVVKVSENATRLSETMKYHGFEIKPDAIQIELNKGKPELQLHAEFKKKDVYDLVASLNLRRDNNGYYHWNSYDATMNHATDEDKNRTQRFYINKGSGVTFKEAANLFEGREIYRQFHNSKDNSSYYAHVSLDFSKKDDKGNYAMNRYGENWRFDEVAALNKYRIREAGVPDDLQDVLKNLHKGNLTKVHIVPQEGDKSGKAIPVFITSDAKNRNFKFYDESGNRLERDKFLVQAPESKVQEKSKGKEKGQSQDLVKEDAPKQNQRTGKKSTKEMDSQGSEQREPKPQRAKAK